jgi:hypothetical protein
MGIFTFELNIHLNLMNFSFSPEAVCHYDYNKFYGKETVPNKDQEIARQWT